MKMRLRALLVTPVLITALACLFGVIGYGIGSVLGMPVRADMPLAMRVAGWAVLLMGFAFLGWIFKYRRPGEVLVSTYLTMMQALTGKPVRESPERTEGLVVEGPQRHVRHPMYFAVVVLFVGWWMVLGYTFLLFMAGIYCLWFNLVVIRFEEIELRHMFGKEYEEYAKAVPRFIPSIRRSWKSGR